MATLTSEQFEQLMQRVGACNVRVGTFTTCTSRYSGERSSTKVEEFISAVTTFKALEKIKDADAISGMPMLLEGDAAEWWSGVKSNAESFDDVVRMLHEACSPPKPAWRICAEICEAHQQKGEPTDTFIRRKCVLFAQLTQKPSEATQIDILFGKLRAEIRERVSRNRVSNFDELLAEAREAEHLLKDRDYPSNSSGEKSEVVRCSFCGKKGHIREKCFKEQKAAKEAEQTAVASLGRPKLACYGCGTPGVIRAKCQNCSKKPLGSGGSAPVIRFNSLISACVGSDVPHVNVKMFGVPGQAILDSGARTSVASANLKRLMDFHNCEFNTENCDITLADGSRNVQSCL